RRLVDAGYYDNYGVDLAAAWAYAHRDWILENTSGLALIQIHANAVEKAKLATLVLNEPKPDSSSWFFDRLSRSFQWLTSPATALVSSRQWSMAFRNDEQLRDLDDVLNGASPGMFRVFVFENPVDFAMNWFISKDDIDRMRDRIGFDLRLMSPLNDVSGIPTEGKDLIIVAAVNNVLHFRIFDGDGKVVVDTDEQRLTEQARQIEDLRKQLQSLWPPHELTWSDKDRVTIAVTSIVGYTPRFERESATKRQEQDQYQFDN